MKSLLWSICYIFWSVYSYSQILPGDDCLTATPLTIDTACVFTNYTTVGSTNSGGVTPNCGAFAGGDVWLKMQVPSSGHLQIKLSSTQFFSWNVYSGSCSSLVSLKCRQGNGFFNINDVSMAGTIVYVRVWRYSNAAGGAFSLCAWEPNTPLNDACSNATQLTVLPVKDFTTLYSNIGATAESASVATTPTCGFYDGGDVWFKAVVPSSGRFKVEWQNVSSISCCVEIDSGSCGAFTKLGCVQLGIDGINFNQPNLAGKTIYLRVFDYSGNNPGGTFNLSIIEPATSVNDHCADAIPLAQSNPCLPGTYSLVGCTAQSTSIAPNPACTGYLGNDAWFTLTMPSTGHLRIERGNNSIGYTLYSGTCGAFTQLECSILSANFINYHNHALANQTLYLRTWFYGNSEDSTSFTLCVTDPNTPENDSCIHAQILNVNQTCSMITYSSNGATKEPTTVAANPICGAYVNNDVWFKLIMPTSGLLTVNATGIGLMQPQFALYSGTCGNFTTINCVQLQNSFSVNNLSLAGQMLYLRIWDYGSPDGTSFNLCAFDPSCLISIDSVSKVASSCNSINDGQLTIYATCANCTGSMEYSLDNGPFQLSHIFTNVASGVHQVKVRDNGYNACLAQSGAFILSANASQQFYYQDLDLDGYGNNSSYVISCSQPSGYIVQGGDCNDANSNIHPGVNEIPCNGTDENCNGLNDDTPSEIAVTAYCNSIFDNQLTISPNGHNGTNFGELSLLDSTQIVYTIKNEDNQPLIISNISLAGNQASSFYIHPLSFPISISPYQDTSFTVKFMPSTVGIHQATLTIINNDCNESVFNFAIEGQGSTSTFTNFTIHAWIQGYYLGAGNQASALFNQGQEACLNVSDSVEVSLYDPLTYNLMASMKTVIMTDGQIFCRFPNLSGSYFLALRHRNSVETWSAAPVTLVANGTYDFASASSQAYGNNEVEVDNGVWALYSGDIAQDGSIDSYDYILLDADIVFGASGYLATDLTGDGVVDAFDYLIIDPNVVNGIGAVTP